ncbi:MAG: hypothetical protein IJN07_03530 [Clostridia bacterium]|nr:hypothetical protein [Clostridia bacterium]
MDNKRRTIAIWVVSLLLVAVMLVAAWFAHKSRQQDWWDGWNDPTTRPDFSNVTVPTDKNSVNVGGLFPTDKATDGTTARLGGGTVATTSATGTATQTTEEQLETSGSRFDNMLSWGDLQP